jgi:hypothetical protein
MCSRRVVGALLLTFDTVPDAGAIITAIGSAVVTAGAGFAGTGRRASGWTRWSITFALLGGRGNRKAMRQSEVADNPVQVGGRIVIPNSRSIKILNCSRFQTSVSNPRRRGECLMTLVSQLRARTSRTDRRPTSFQPQYRFGSARGKERFIPACGGRTQLQSTGNLSHGCPRSKHGCNCASSSAPGWLIRVLGDRHKSAAPALV